MKKLFIGLTFLFLSIVSFSQINLKVNSGVKEFTNKVYIDGILLNKEETKGSFSVAVEYEKVIKDKMSIGIGLEHGYINDPDNFVKVIKRTDSCSITDSSTLTEITTIPIYIYGKYIVYNKNGLEMYTKLYLGYSFNEAKDNVYRQITQHSKGNDTILFKEEYNTKAYNSLWYGAGIGLEYNTVFCEVNYRYNNMDIKINEYRQNYNRDRIEFSVGFIL